MPGQLLAPLGPDENALTRLFARNVDDAMLREIAAADYGWKAEECYALLQPLFHGAAPSQDFNLREVLELIRWSDPADPAWAPGGHGIRGHWMRLFACVALVRLAPAMPDSFDGESCTFAQFTASAIELGPEAARAAASVMAWRFLEYPGNTQDAPFLAFAILLLAAQLERGEDRGAWLKDLAAWVEEEEARAREAGSGWRESMPNWNVWLLGLTLFDLRDAVWRELARRVLARPERPHPRTADEALRLLGELVAGI